MKLSKLGILPIFVLLIVACNDDDSEPMTSIPEGDFVNGILISNEGPFQNGTGTVSFISEDLETVQNAIYNAINNDNLGNIVQSIGFADDLAYIVANNSNRITVVNRFTFKREAVIETGLNNPRYFVAANGKGYVSNWGDTADETDDYIAVINLSNQTVEGSIAVDFGPEELVVESNTVYVAHQGAFGQNDKVSVIDDTDTVSEVITVGDVPNALLIDANGSLWVLSGGKPSFTGEETAGSLSRINTNTNEVEFSLDFQTTEHPNHLGFDGVNLYYTLAGSVYSIATTATELPSEAILENVGTYAMTVENGRLFITDAKDFASDGSLSIYDLNSRELVQTLDVGIIPGGIFFN